MDGSPDPLIRSAATDVSRHCLIDVGIRRPGLGANQSGGGHDHSWLAVPALRDFLGNASALYRMAPISGEPLNGRHLLTYDVADACGTRSDGIAVQVNGARAAETHATTKFG